ncbi:MAG: hypothetical protein GY838_05650 [bacterium]|nr:hypothetical protein [bacterium]
MNEIQSTERLLQAGFRFGDKGTHTSRTMMLSELSDLLNDLPPEAERADYAAAIIEENVLGKQTTATRRLTNQRLGELYGLDPRLPLFRVLRRVWSLDEAGRPLIALLCALCRDPLLRATARTVIDLPLNAELMRSSFLDTIREAVGPRLNDSILDKVARNAGSSWSQSGHLEGRVRKIRQRVQPTAGSTAYALWLGSLEDLAGNQLLSSRWARMLDTSGEGLIDYVLQAKQLGLVDARIGGGVVEIEAERLFSSTME